MSVKVWGNGQVIESVPSLDTWIAAFPAKTFGAFLSAGFAGHLLTGDPDTRNCAHLALGFVDGTPAAQVRAHPDDDNPGGLLYLFGRPGDNPPGIITRELGIAQPFYFLKMAMSFAETVGEAVEQTHFDVTTRRQ